MEYNLLKKKKERNEIENTCFLIHKWAICHCSVLISFNLTFPHIPFAKLKYHFQWKKTKNEFQLFLNPLSKKNGIESKKEQMENKTLTPSANK